MTRPTGIHHLAISTGDIKQQIEFFTDVLGGELVALYWMHGVDGAWHGFVRLNDSCYVAFVEMDANRQIDAQIGVTHAGSGAGACAPGTMQHVAFKVDTTQQLLNMRDRIRSRGVNVIGYLDHGLCKSIYFAGPEGLTLEVAQSDAPIDAQAWIDPEVAALADINDEELERYRHPAAFVGTGGSLPQPPMDPSKPHPTMARERYEAVLAMPDSMVSETLSISDPPVRDRQVNA